MHIYLKRLDGLFKNTKSCGIMRHAVLLHMARPDLRNKEKDSNAKIFLERNFKTENPDLWLTDDMVQRSLSGEAVLEKTPKGFEEMPNFDLYGAGFPCTPWSRLPLLILSNI